MKDLRMAAFTIRYEASVINADIPDLPATVRTKIKSAIEQKLSTNPVEFGKPLRYSFKGFRRLRVGDYRVIFSISVEKQEVIIAAIRHRKDAYD